MFFTEGKGKHVHHFPQEALSPCNSNGTDLEILQTVIFNLIFFPYSSVRKRITKSQKKNTSNPV